MIETIVDLVKAGLIKVLTDHHAILDDYTTVDVDLQDSENRISIVISLRKK
jgi:hypothetical protein